MTIVRGGKITPYTWTDVDGKRQKSWRWSANVDGKQRRRQGYATKAEAETGLDAPTRPSWPHRRRSRRSRSGRRLRSTSR
jgi:hypothetical protein